MMVSVPMDCGIVWGLIGNSDDYSVTFLCINNWSREHSVYCYYILGVTQLRNSCRLDLIVIRKKE